MKKVIIVGSIIAFGLSLMSFTADQQSSIEDSLMNMELNSSSSDIELTSVFGMKEKKTKKKRRLISIFKTKVSKDSVSEVVTSDSTKEDIQQLANVTSAKKMNSVLNKYYI